MIIRISISCVVSCLISLTASAEDWATYRHDNARSGVTREKLPTAALQQKWVYRSPHSPQTAWAGPAKWDAFAKLRGLRSMRNYDAAFHVVVADDSVYFGSSVDDSLHCLDAATGHERWLYCTDAPVRVPPTIGNRRAYFGSDDGYAYCIDASNGQLVWRFQPPVQEHRILHNGRFISYWPCRTGVTIDAGTAYFGLAMLPWREAFLCAVDAETGQADGPGRFVQRLHGATLEGSLLLTSEHLITSRGRVSPYLFERKNGRSIGELKGGGGSFVTVTDDNQILHGPGNKTGWLTVSDVKSRKIIKQHNGYVAAVATPKKLLLQADNRLTALERSTRKLAWDVPCPYPHSIIVAGDDIFVGGRDSVAAYRLSDGHLVWRSSVNGNAFGLAAANGALYVSTDEGAIHCFRAGSETTLEPPSANTEPSVAKESPLREANEVTTPGLIGRWLFRSGMGTRARRRGLPNADRRVDDLAGTLPATVQGKPQLRRVGGVEAIELDERTTGIVITDDHNKAKLPAKQITAEAWVRVDKPDRWGGIIGAIQDNGEFERGWILGFNDSKFSFAVAGKQGPNKLTYLTAKSEFQKGMWYHVVGTYDGSVQKVYVNGKLENRSTEQKGEINYPPQFFYEMGAYHDKDEKYRMTGMLHEVRVYNRALAAADVEKHYAAKISQFPIPIRLALGPYAQFTGLGSAVVRWHTNRPSPTILEYVRDGRLQRVGDPQPKLEHEAVIRNIRRNLVTSYVIKSIIDGRQSSTPTFELDSHFDFAVAPVRSADSPFPDDTVTKLCQTTARHVLETAALDRGIGLVYGCGDGRLIYELLRRSQLRVIGVDTDRRRVANARRVLMKAGVYGSRAAIHYVDSLENLPFVDGFANLIVSEHMLREGRCPGAAAEIFRVLRPNGGIALLGQPAGMSKKLSAAELRKWLQVASLKFPVDEGTDGVWSKIVRGRLPGGGDWSHLYGRPDNSAFGGETLGGASTTGELQVKWMGRPGPRAQADRNGRKPSPLSTNGRLFVQGLHRLIGMDAHNGTILWSLEISPLERFNMPRDSGNWCADDKHVFVAVRGCCWQIDAQTGKVVKFHHVPPSGRNDWEFDWGYVARQGGMLLGSAVKQGTAFTNFWGNADAGWYDARSGPATYKVCSDTLFAFDESTAEMAWKYSNGVIINSTITTANGRVYFVECRNQQVNASASRRVGMKELWDDQFLVAVDLRTGKLVWEQPLNTADGVVVFYMAFGDGKLVITSSSNNQYEVNTFDASSGKADWRQSFGWPQGKGDHGKAMSRPAIVGGKLYVRPKVFELKSGKVLPLQMPSGGCGTYAATTNAFFFRSSNVTAWNTITGSTTKWDRLRPGCWLSTIPAGGMLLSPEAGGGCSCGSWMETSIGFTPRR